MTLKEFLLKPIDYALSLAETLSDIFIKTISLNILDITFSEIGNVIGYFIGCFVFLIILLAPIFWLLRWTIDELFSFESEAGTSGNKVCPKSIEFLFITLPAYTISFALLAVFILSFVWNAGPRTKELSKSWRQKKDSYSTNNKQNPNPANKIEDKRFASLMAEFGIYNDAAFKRKDYETAYKLALQHAEEKGGTRSQFHLGWMYEMGQGVPQDYKEAFKWYLRSAIQGNFNGQLYLGKMYETGQGVPQDYKEAARLFRVSAEQEHDKAQFKMGNIFEEGIVVSQNFSEAVKWYALSAEQDFTQAKVKLYELAKKNIPQALEILRYDSDIGVAKAQGRLGEIYSQGLILPANYLEAHMWYSLAVLRGNGSVIAEKIELEKNMSPDQINEAQEMARNWKPDRVKVFWEQLKVKFEGWW